MNVENQRLRQEAVAELKKFGITGSQIYLIDLIPLIEMIWADGHAQESEVNILDNYLLKHIEHINKIANTEVLTFEDASRFVQRFLKNRPDPDLLKTLRSFVAPVRLTSSDEQGNDAIRQSLLAACLDIASSSVTKYPYGIDQRFNPEEKRCYFEIVESLL